MTLSNAAPSEPATLGPKTTARIVEPGQFEADNHFYPRVLNAQLHPLVRFLLKLGNGRIAERYRHLHPEAHPEAVHAALSNRTRLFRWGGSDLFHTTDDRGRRRLAVVETNSCPSGQKSMPRDDESDELGGYRRLLEGAFLPALRGRRLPAGDLAVLYDKNPMEASGYAAALADITGESVLLAPCFVDEVDPCVRFTADRVLSVRDDAGAWRPVRAALRYVTQRPWTRIPPTTRTLIFNPVLACLAGGRNKLLASKAYDLYNAELAHQGLRIRTPETIWDVAKAEIPLWVTRMGGVAVIKDPYSNAGQGVWTITNQGELSRFMALEARYDRFIVQALVGNAGWSSRAREGRLYHVGTVPDRRRHIHATDVRFMVCNGPDGFFPVSIYARRASQPLAAELTGDEESWSMLGTNLSKKRPDGGWDTETERLLLMDNRDFNRLGLGLDELIEGYIQTSLAVTAIDKMAGQLLNSNGRFRKRLFASLTPDPALSAEIYS